MQGSMRTGRSAHRAAAERREVRGRPRPHSGLGAGFNADREVRAPRRRRTPGGARTSPSAFRPGAGFNDREVRAPGRRTPRGVLVRIPRWRRPRGPHTTDRREVRGRGASSAFHGVGAATRCRPRGPHTTTIFVCAEQGAEVAGPSAYGRVIYRLALGDQSTQRCGGVGSPSFQFLARGHHARRSGLVSDRGLRRAGALAVVFMESSA